MAIGSIFTRWRSALAGARVLNRGGSTWLSPSIVAPSLLWLACAGAGLAGVGFIYAVVSPVGPVGDWQAQRPQIATPAQRTMIFSGLDPFFRVNTPADAGGAVSTSGLFVYGIRVNESSGQGSAILGSGDGDQQSYAIGDEVTPGVRLVGVAFDHVVLERGGAQEKLFIDQSGGVAPVGDANTAGAGLPPVDSGPHPTPPAGKIRQGAAALQSGIDWRPRSEGGRVTGVLVRPKPGSPVFAEAGFRDGDVVTRINDRPVTGASDLAEVAARVGTGGVLRLMVERGSATVPIELVVED